jgi:hypothetical protein
LSTGDCTLPKARETLAIDRDEPPDDFAFVRHEDDDALVYFVFDSIHIASVGSWSRVDRTFKYPQTEKITEIGGDANMTVADVIQSLSNSAEKLELSLPGEDRLLDPFEKFCQRVPRSSTVPFPLAEPPTRSRLATRRTA